VTTNPGPLLRWADVYREPELYKAAIRVYTKPLFAWRKALSTSSDERTLYDFARHGLRNLDALHRALAAESFRFRPGLALRYDFNGRKRTLYVYPWEERILDLLLYRVLNARLHSRFSPHAYAYRQGPFGVDACQRRIAQALSASGAPLFVLKRDISDYFASIDHGILLRQLAEWIEPGDYLYRLLRERIEFRYLDGDALETASRGIPFGAAIACVFANLHLMELDRSLSGIEELRYFRYADDFLMISPRRDAALEASRRFDASLEELHLKANPRHARSLVFSTEGTAEPGFEPAGKFRHLGLEFRADGSTGLSRDKSRKICNLFRYAFRRQRSKFRKRRDPVERARLAVDVARRTLTEGVRNVAIIDYYLKHVDDEEQLRMLDRWLAEEVLSVALETGHRKGNFRAISFEKLRQMGLPSLVHRRRLIRHGHLESPFFIWKTYQASRGSQGTAARPRKPAAFSPGPEAAVAEHRVGERDRL
jgi:hypothetical protein